jgi:EF hand
MRKLTALFLAGGCLIAASFDLAQNAAPADGLVARMMAFDKNGDGKLTKSEVTDERLHRLFDRADADKDGTVTKAELTALEARESARFRGGPGGFGPPGGPGGPGGPMMAPPRPGEILPSFLRRALDLTPEQKAQLDELQKDVDSRLAKILTDAQKKTLDQMRRRGPGGPGGFGPPGGRRGPGPGGPPPPPDERQ